MMEANLHFTRPDSWNPKFFKNRNFIPQGHLIFGALLLLWLLLPRLLTQFDPRAGAVDPSIWLLILLSMLSFLLLVALSWGLLYGFWLRLGLPGMGLMVLQFNSLALWQQLGFYWLSFALLLLGSILSLMAIC